MPTKRCCCGAGSCLLLQDLFERENSTSLGADWTEEAGDASIVSSKLQLDAGDKVATVARNPGSTRGYASILFTAPSSGVVSGDVTLNFGSTGEVVLSFEFDDDYLTLVAGSQTRTIDDTVLLNKPQVITWQRDGANEYQLEVAMSDNIAYIRLYGTDVESPRGAAVWDHEFSRPTSGGGKLAIECTAGQLLIDSVAYYRYYDDRTDCPRVGCLCDSEAKRYVPWKTRVDFFSSDGTGNGCDVFNGGYLLFENVLDGGQESGSNRWEAFSGEIAGQGYGYGVNWPVAFFECNTAVASTPFGMSLSIFDCVDPVDALASDTIACHPFSVTYATISITDLAEPCHPCVGSLGSFYAVMTDDT